MPKRKKNKQKISTITKVLIICEGDTEEDLVNGLLKENQFLSDNIKTMSLNGSGYKKIQETFYKNKLLYKIILYITDLDRAEELDSEKRTLKGNIALLDSHNNHNNIFLSYPEIEIYIAACIGMKIDSGTNKEKILDYLKNYSYSKGKGSYKLLSRNRTKYDQDLRDMLIKYLYYDKFNNNIGVYYEENLNRPQSSIVLLINYIKKILSK